MGKRKPTATEAEPGEILLFDPQNANRHTEQGLTAVQLSVARLGAGRSIVVDSSNTVVAGEATLKAAQQLGLPTRVVETDGGELVVVDCQDLLTATGFSDQELMELLSPPMPPDAPEDFNEVDETIETEHTCPKCGYRFSGGS